MKMLLMILAAVAPTAAAVYIGRTVGGWVGYLVAVAVAIAVSLLAGYLVVPALAGSAGGASAPREVVTA